MNNSILAALFMIFLSGCERPIQHVKCYNNTGKVIYEGVAHRQGIGDCFFERKNERIIK